MLVPREPRAFVDREQRTHEHVVREVGQTRGKGSLGAASTVWVQVASTKLLQP